MKRAASSAGKTTAKCPSSESRRTTASRRSPKGSRTAWRAVVRPASGQVSESTKNGGLETTRSNFPCGANSCTGHCTNATLPPHGEASAFSRACEMSSTSTPVIRAPGTRCAIISAISPVPVPISRMRLSDGRTETQAPSSTPSVPTFIGQRSWRMANCLKRNIVSML